MTTSVSGPGPAAVSGPPEPRAIEVLVVEDEPAEALLIRHSLGHPWADGRRAPCSVTHAESLGGAMSLLDARRFDVCLLDLSLPDSHGMATVRTLSAAFPDLPIIVLTGDDREETEDEAMRNGGQDFLVKGEAEPRVLLRAIKHARERARLQADLRTSHARFRDFAEVSADWFWEMDARMRFTWVSGRLESVTGLVPAALLGRSREEIGVFDPADPAWRAYQADAAACRPIRNFEYTVETAAGRRWFRVNGRPVFDGAAFMGYRGTGTDITALRTAQDRLAEERDRAERATEAKSRFLATMSHEIRTPLTGVLGMAELLRDTPLDDRQRDYVANILDAGETLLALINDILDMAKIEAGRLEIKPSAASLRAEVEGCLRLLRPKADDKGLTLTLEWAAGAVDWLHMDRMRVRQIVLNLLSNAVKFTDRGGVTVTVGVAPRDDGADGAAGGNGIRIAVTDTGIGIAAAALARLFTEYTQADAATAQRFGGTGLGLSISKRLAEMMGGTLGATSTPDRGSRFWLWLPLVEAEAPAAPENAGSRSALPPATATARPLRILVADDNRINRLLLTTFLGALGHRVEAVEDGARAVAAARAALDTAGAEREAGGYDVVLMDVMMPQMDGLEATRALRAAAEPALARLPVIGVTADAMSDRLAGFLEAGMTGVVSKPIDRAELLRAIDAALER